MGFVVPGERDEVADGVRILSVPVPRNGRERLTTTTRLVVRRALAASRSAKATVFHIHDAEMLPLALGLAARGRTVVYDAHENTPRQMLHQAWIPRPLRRPAGWSYAALEAIAGRAFAGIIAAVPVIAARFPKEKTVLIRNFPILGADRDGVQPLSQREPILAYVGAVTRARGAAEMIGAVGRMTRDTRAQLEIAGSAFPAALPDELAQLDGSARTSWLGRLGRAEVDALLDRARVGLAVLHDTPQYRDAYPTKLFEYMAAGVPAVVSDFPLWREMVEGAGCGLLVDPLNVDAIAAACTAILQDAELAQRLGDAGKRAARDRFNWALEGDRLLAFYDAVRGGSTSPGAFAHEQVPV